jgi:lipoprotein-releasing system permease protein
LQPLPLFIGLRYTRAKRQNHYISFISMASMVGLMIGIAALITVMSVMNGFQKEIRSRMLSVSAHAQVLGFDTPESRGLTDWKSVQSELAKNPEVVSTAPFVDGQGLMAHGTTAKGAVVRGILPDQEVTVADFARDLRAGNLESLQPGEYRIILGQALARSLGVSLGDKVQLLTPQGNMTAAGMVPRMRTFTVSGLFASGHHEFDITLALMHLRDAQVLFQFDQSVSGVRIKLREPDLAPMVASELARSLKIDGYISDWTRQNPIYFRAVQIEKRMIAIVLTLIVLVAAFNLVSTLVMVVTDKHPDIAILRTLGASPSTIMRIFVVQGAIVGLIGTLLGVIVGVVLAMNVDVVVPAVERVLGLKILAPEVYFLSDLPSDLRWSEVWLTAAMSLTLSLLATLYPSWRASKVNPAEALRYE